MLICLQQSWKMCKDDGVCIAKTNTVPNKLHCSFVFAQVLALMTLSWSGAWNPTSLGVLMVWNFWKARRYEEWSSSLEAALWKQLFAVTWNTCFKFAWYLSVKKSMYKSMKLWMAELGCSKVWCSYLDLWSRLERTLQSSVVSMQSLFPHI